MLEIFLSNKKMEYEGELSDWHDLGGLNIIKKDNLTKEKPLFNFIRFSFHELIMAKYLVSLLTSQAEDFPKKDILKRVFNETRVLHLKNVFQFVKLKDIDVFKKNFERQMRLLTLLEKKIFQI